MEGGLLGTQYGSHFAYRTESPPQLLGVFGAPRQESWVLDMTIREKLTVAGYFSAEGFHETRVLATYPAPFQGMH